MVEDPFKSIYKPQRSNEREDFWDGCLLMAVVWKQSVETILQNISTFIGLQNTSSPVKKQQIAKKVESNANVVGGVCAKDRNADGEEGGVVEGDQAVHLLPEINQHTS